MQDHPQDHVEAIITGIIQTQDVKAIAPKTALIITRFLKRASLISEGFTKDEDLSSVSHLSGLWAPRASGSLVLKSEIGPPKIWNLGLVVFLSGRGDWAWNRDEES